MRSRWRSWICSSSFAHSSGMRSISSSSFVHSSRSFLRRSSFSSWSPPAAAVVATVGANDLKMNEQGFVQRSHNDRFVGVVLEDKLRVPIWVGFSHINLCSIVLTPQPALAHRFCHLLIKFRIKKQALRVTYRGRLSQVYSSLVSPKEPKADLNWQPYYPVATMLLETQDYSLKSHLKIPWLTKTGTLIKSKTITI